MYALKMSKITLLGLDKSYIIQEVVWILLVVVKMQGC